MITKVWRLAGNNQLNVYFKPHLSLKIFVVLK